MYNSAVLCAVHIYFNKYFLAHTVLNAFPHCGFDFTCIVMMCRRILIVFSYEIHLYYSSTEVLTVPARSQYAIPAHISNTLIISLQNYAFIVILTHLVLWPEAEKWKNLCDINHTN